MRRVPICWHAMEESFGRGRFDSCAQFNDMLDLYDVTHYGCRDQMPESVEGAVVVVHGGRELGRIDKLNEDIKKLQWLVLVLLGDEENSFPLEQVEHPHKKIWIQEPLPGRHDFADRFMINGYGHDRKRHIVQVERDLDWFFGGQVTHERRRACVDALRTMSWGGVVLETKGYYQGVQMSEYVRLLCRAKIVPCPSGPFSPDAARPWDALECGAIPVLDDLSPTRKESGFWRYVFGGLHPFPVITDWSTLPAMIEDLKIGWESHSRSIQGWWQVYKKEFNSWLLGDLKDLGVECTRNS